nr:hypothetical protein [Tanacetum cinerariifolium]
LKRLVPLLVTLAFDLNFSLIKGQEWSWTWILDKLIFNCKLLAVESPFFWQWEHPPLAVGTYTASGNSLLAKLEENLVTYSPDFQNISEPSNASTNVVNAPREPYVVKQDNGSFVDKINSDLNRAPDSPDQFHCFHCKDVLRACAKCGSGLGKGLCYICGHNQNSLNDLPSISETSSQSPPNINHCCYECGDPLDGIFCKSCTSPFIYSESCYNQDFNFPQDFQDVPQQYPCCDDCGREEKRIEEEQAAKAQTWKLPVCYDDDDDEERSNSLDDNIILGLSPFSAITPDAPVLSTEEPDNSLSMGDEHLDTIPATELDEFIKSGVETLIPIPSESEGIPEHMCDVPFLDNSPPLDASKDQIEDFSESNEEFSSTDDDSFSLDNIDYVEASPPDFELVSSEVMKIVIPEVGGIKGSNDNPIPFHDPIISRNPLNLTPSGESDFFLEVDAFHVVEDESTSSQFPKSYLDPEGDMLLFEAFLNDDHSFDFKTKSSSTSLNSLLEETNNFHNSLPEFTTFSKVLFDTECKSDSSDDQSCSDEDILKKIVSKPLSEEEIIPMKSLRIHDSSLPIWSKIDSLLDEFAGELGLLKSIPLGIDETDCDFEEDICLIEKLLYDNSSPRPSEEFVSANSDAAIKSFSPSPILVKDSDSLIEEIDLFCTPDYPMPPSIVNKDYDSERDILIPKDLPSNKTLSFAEKESFHFEIPPFSRPPAKLPDGDTGIMNIKMMGDIFDQKAFMHKLMITLSSHQEKSPDLLSHRCETVKKFNTHRSHLNTCPMLIHGLDTILRWMFFCSIFIPLDSLKYGGNLVQLI